jgi:hypothetical protein
VTTTNDSTIPMDDWDDAFLRRVNTIFTMVRRQGGCTVPVNDAWRPAVTYLVHGDKVNVIEREGRFYLGRAR